MINNEKFTKYKIQYVNKPLLLFKQRHEIVSLSYKPQRIDCLTNQNNQDFSLLRERQMNYSKKQRAYANKIANTKIGVIDHIEKKIFLYDIDGIFRFENFSERKVTMQNMKSLTRDELDYKKRNVNYMLRKIDFEDCQELKYKKGDVNELKKNVETKEIENTTVNVNNNIKERIKTAIFRARIVNYKVLLDIFENESVSIQEVLLEMCIKLKGRFVLKNKYYDKIHRKMRQKILNKIEASKSEMYDYNIMFDKGDLFVVNEICEKKNGFYCLKGFYENISICEQKIEINEIFNEIFNDFGIVSIKRICKELEKDAEDVEKIVEQNKNIVKLKNKTYVMRGSENQEFRNIIIDVFTENVTIKKNELLRIIKEKTGKEMNVFLFGKILKEFATYKANTYYLKSGEADEK
ncbi:hypothetical protein BDAP_000468 [Binucleata daphniae]